MKRRSSVFPAIRRHPRLAILAWALMGFALACGGGPSSSPRASLDVPTGRITGHVRMNGVPPPNEIIRMRADLLCDKANAGRQVRHEAILVGVDGGLANAFVQLQGDFPGHPAPSEPVVIDQRACVYLPRVVGLQLGQPLRVLNSDAIFHNVHGISSGQDGFNVGQPVAGMAHTFTLKEEGILQLRCDVHGWMMAYVGVVNHPHFAVTPADGSFTLANVPAGTHTIRVWHEQYGVRTSAVRVDAEQTAAVELVYAGN
jgi:plastocyanin